MHPHVNYIEALEITGATKHGNRAGFKHYMAQMLHADISCTCSGLPKVIVCGSMPAVPDMCLEARSPFDATLEQHDPASPPIRFSPGVIRVAGTAVLVPQRRVLAVGHHRRKAAPVRLRTRQAPRWTARGLLIGAYVGAAAVEPPALDVRVLRLLVVQPPPPRERHAKRWPRRRWRLEDLSRRLPRRGLLPFLRTLPPRQERPPRRVTLRRRAGIGERAASPRALREHRCPA